MSTIWYGLQVTIVGMLVVFAGLIILILSIGLMELIFKRPAKKQESLPIKEEPASAVHVKATPAQDDGVLIAVITAAIAAALSQEGATGKPGFVVRAIRRTRSIPAWNRAGREEQIYSRL